MLICTAISNNRDTKIRRPGRRQHHRDLPLEIEGRLSRPTTPFCAWWDTIARISSRSPALDGPDGRRKWRDLDARAVDGFEDGRELRPVEKEYSARTQPCAVLIAQPPSDEQRNEGVGLVLDLTERKRGGSRSP